MFCIVVHNEGLWIGLGPFTVWQMVTYPNKWTNYPGFPLCAWVLLRAAEGPATRTACQQWQRRLLSHLHLHHPSFSFPFFTFNVYSFLSHLCVHNQISEGFCFNTVRVLYLAGECSFPEFENLQMGMVFDWFRLPLLSPWVVPIPMLVSEMLPIPTKMPALELASIWFHVPIRYHVIWYKWAPVSSVSSALISRGGTISTPAALFPNSFQ